MKKKALFILLFSISTLLFSQEDKNWRLINKINVSADFFRIDPLKNIYTVKNNTLSKYTLHNGKYTCSTYSNREFGNISSLDVSNPFKILIFYYHFQSIQFLDNKLIEISEPIYLDDLGVIESNLVCASKESGFWVFDHVNQLISHFDNNLKLKETSLRLSSMFEENLQLEFMQEKNNNLYVNTLEGKILVFDNYTNLEKVIPISIAFNFSVERKKLNYYSNEKNKMYSYYLTSLETRGIDLSWKKNILDAQIEQKNLYIFTPKEISIFIND